MTQVFISYSRRDIAFIEQLAADLQAAGLDVWYDLSDLEAGERWSKEIEKAIRASEDVIMVLSPDSVASEWVEEEILYARNLKRKIVPLYYKPCDLPLGYHTRHYIDVQGIKYKRNFGEILQSLGVKPGTPKKPPLPEKAEPIPAKPEGKEEAPKPKKLSKQWKLNSKNISILVALIALILVSVFVLPRLFSQPLTDVPPSEITDEFGVEMVLVPAGEFTMGSESGYEDEKPVHNVYLDDFYIDIYEVTNNLYKACVQSEKCQPPADINFYTNSRYGDHPVVFVNWHMASNYCDWRGARLPTEAEWEKAARGLDKRIYAWGNDFNPDISNVFLSGLGGTNAVGIYELGKSPYGVYDMTGNVGEWTSSLYQTYPYNSEDGREDQFSSDQRVIRGGSFGNSDFDTRTVSRFSEDSSKADRTIGFRCAKGIPP